MAKHLVYTSAPTSALGFINPLGMIANLWQHRNLIHQFSIREARGRYKGSYLGIVWSFLTPLLMLAVYTFVFSAVLKVKWRSDGTSDAEFSLTLFCGMIVFNIFGECMARASGLVVGNPSYVKKVVFPLEILPLSVFFSAVIHAGISLAILLVATGLLMHSISWHIVLFPLVLVPLAFLSLAVGWFLAGLGVFLRDIGYVASLSLQVLTFMTPIFFPFTAVPEQHRWLMYINPLSAVVEGSRAVLLWGQQPDWIWLLKVTVFSMVAMQFGYIFFMKSKKAFGDVI